MRRKILSLVYTCHGVLLLSVMLAHISASEAPPQDCTNPACASYADPDLNSNFCNATQANDVCTNGAALNCGCRNDFVPGTFGAKDCYCKKGP